MAVAVSEPADAGAALQHAAWVRVCHWVLTASVLTLVVTGVEILMVHPRLYWGEVGNDLTPALLELPISRNYRHGGYEAVTPFFERAARPVSASRTFDIFNQNGWGRSLHFLAAWGLALAGTIYLLMGLADGHFHAHVWPRLKELAPALVWRDVIDHVRFRIRPPTGGPRYGLLQKCAYSFVVFVAGPLIVLTGLAMSPAMTAAAPLLTLLFGGYQSARTIHFFTFAALVGFVLVHLVMVVASGFRRQLRGMTLGD
jgi:thiosulfate reductase cytochrome b subunit